MKKLIILSGLIGGAAALNAAIGSDKECNCEPGCWCKKPGLRHFRWVIPLGHQTPSISS